MKILLASTFNKIVIECLKKAKPTNLLFSYYYIGRKDEKETKKVLKHFRDNGVFIMIDSGAHTFFSEEGLSIAHSKKKKTKSTDFLVYAKAYAEWLVKFKDYIDVAVELDIDVIIGYPKVKKIRKMLEASGAKIMPVWHTSLGDKEWENMLRDYEYVGIGLGDAANSKQILNIGFFAKKLQRAIETDTKVHAFGMVRPNYMLKLPFYTVDSSSWNAGSRYGQLVGYNAKSIRIVQRRVKSQKDFLKVVNYLKLDMSPSKLFEVAKSYVNRDVVNIQAYKKLEDVITRVWESRGIKQ